ncbi:OmpA family protein [Altererythrobacter sp.]|jgi:outer membrane protein OmpA-like peptidoglycan-associated protein|uniref:OmpA family protein n=1 Tax=Altererythrobacter sp. TaxID=1872480 RepID=UPI001B293231|nr:OmpA family protein [Altererythrobacter sp.]MBO6609245.1 OmpA family protein [Altererythrobacter sp.]MBO6641229.1 OmpA family protein [Altererythrobacter sp.]MBO6708073.1 OmpA family protein [Altererythrobacter sp.]
MKVNSNGSKAMIAIAAFALPAWSGAVAQEEPAQSEEVLTTVIGVEGPEIEGVITARNDDRLQITSANGTTTTVAVNDETRVRGTGGFLGLGRKSLGINSLLNGLPVKVETWQSGETLVASDIRFKNSDLETAAMIRNGTAQQFAAQGARIDKNEVGVEENARAAEALRGRLGDIDQYNIKGVTNVYFASGRYQLSGEAREKLCAAAAEADAIENSLLLVVGYTDSTGSYEVNQRLSEQRAGRVVNYLQQECSWKPFRMLTPTGMAASDPTADNSTAEGRAQNRRVSVNILVSKALDGIGDS